MSHNATKPRTGISLASLFFSVPPFLPHYGERLNEFCEKTGLGLHIVPLWMMSQNDIISIDASHVISYEDVWGERTTFWQWVRRLPKHPSSIWKPLVFGFPQSGKKCLSFFRKRFPHAWAINTDGKYPLIKGSPFNWKKALLSVEQGNLVCIDLRYTQGNPLLEKLCLSGLVELINKAPSSIKLIYMSTDTLKALDTIAYHDHRKKTPYENILELLSHLLRQNDIPIIVDTNPSPQKILPTIENHIHKITASLGIL